jgi:hypothetical protein
MANKFTYQVLRDTTTDAVIKLTGLFDGTSGQEMNLSRIQANTLNNALATNGYLLANSTTNFANTPLSYYDLQVTGVKYYVNFPTNNVGGVEIFWSGNNTTGTFASGYANSSSIFHLNMQGEFGLGEQLPSITNNSGDGVRANTVGNGDIGVQTSGGTANSAYTLIISLRKNNTMYQRGQYSDPAAFNYNPYNIKP